MPYDRPRRPGEDVLKWAVETQRVAASSVPNWRTMMAGGTVPEEFIERLGTPLRPDPHTQAALVRVDTATRYRPGGSQVAASAPAVPAGVDPQLGEHYELNPRVDQIARNHPGMMADAMAVNPNPPTLFSGGDLPPFCESGMDPAVLTNVPWYARHAVAEAPDLATARQLVETYSGADGALAASMEQQYHQGNRDYRARVDQWAVAGNKRIVEREYETRRQERIAASGAEPPDPADLSEDALFDLVLGEPIRQRDARIDEHRAAVARGGTVGNAGWNGGLKSTERKQQM